MINITTQIATDQMAFTEALKKGRQIQETLIKEFKNLQDHSKWGGARIQKLIQDINAKCKALEDYLYGVDVQMVAAAQIAKDYDMLARKGYDAEKQFVQLEKEVKAKEKYFKEHEGDKKVKLEGELLAKAYAKAKSDLDGIRFHFGSFQEHALEPLAHLNHADRWIKETQELNKLLVELKKLLK